MALDQKKKKKKIKVSDTTHPMVQQEQDKQQTFLPFRKKKKGKNHTMVNQIPLGIKRKNIQPSSGRPSFCLGFPCPLPSTGPGSLPCKMFPCPWFLKVYAFLRTSQPSQPSSGCWLREWNHLRVWMVKGFCSPSSGLFVSTKLSGRWSPWFPKMLTNVQV